MASTKEKKWQLWHPHFPTSGSAHLGFFMYFYFYFIFFFRQHHYPTVSGQTTGIFAYCWCQKSEEAPAQDQRGAAVANNHHHNNNHQKVEAVRVHFSFITVQHPAESRLEISSFFSDGQVLKEGNLHETNKEKPAVSLRWRVFFLCRSNTIGSESDGSFVVVCPVKERPESIHFQSKDEPAALQFHLERPLVASLPFLCRINQDGEKPPATRTGRHETPLKINRNSTACRHNRPDI